jgi:hypothetical protein
VHSFEAMGCEVIIEGAGARELSAIENLRMRDDVFSRFGPTSELNAVNAKPSNLVALSPLFADVLRRALAAAAQTRGLVDATVAAAVETADRARASWLSAATSRHTDRGCSGALPTSPRGDGGRGAGAISTPTPRSP